MAPLKILSKNGNENISGIVNNTTMGVSTRSRNGALNFKSTLKQAVKAVGKRKAPSPLRDSKAGKVKRAAFGDITNAITNGIQANDKGKNDLGTKKVDKKTLPAPKMVRKKPKENNIAPVVNKVLRSQRSSINVKNGTDIEEFHINANNWPVNMVVFPSNPTKENTIQSEYMVCENQQKSKANNLTRISEDFDETSLYISAIEDMSIVSKQSNDLCNKSEKEPSLTRDINLLAISDKDTSIPDGVSDFDKDNWNDPFQVSNYAMDIFKYLKSREVNFIIKDYLPRQKTLTSWMRSLLVDWMVEVQESFELNHETLYLAVKLVDLYLCSEMTKKDELQLLGSAALFIASKFDERIPPLVDDFLYICDGAYSLKQLLAMEIHILKTINFDIGIPLSYRFLRRYARCARVSMPTLTLARFVLESCLLEYYFVSFSDSKMAAAALYLSIKMKNLGEWTATHIYYTGYTLEEILPIAKAQNLYLHRKPKEGLSTVRNKYSNKVFFEVAKIPLISDDDL